ncbi:FAD-dependent oxidoreductase [Chitinophagaceae bacterium LB-8]|uniref:FAD-dependent oxidoreductase n=1 Tax=Paraflavisolibacter caeni TaxID=2982496 RepID=A0A9X2XPW4_9BACT|nr:FAD-dependent oxidoreductase [Paraflavisolibacter caeni]MCU7551984.1 FAD-dependent oxidoreductase [Paraflavisolibacter caeni]
MDTTPVWKTNAQEIFFPSLANDITVDVAIVGGGITGITAAYLLSSAGKRVVVLESGKIANGSTGHSTGNLYAPVGNDGLHSLKSKWSEDVMRQVVTSRAEAVDFIEATINELNIECDFKRVPWCLFAEKSGNKSYVEAERKMAEKAGLTISNEVPLNLPVETGFSILNQAQFNPLQYTSSLAQKIQSDNCQVYDFTKVTNVKEGETCTVETNGGTVTASQVIMATHTPKGIYLVHTSMEPYREYAVAVILNSDYPPPGIFWNMLSTQHYSLRTYDTPDGRMLIVIGESHKVGTREWNNECFQKLEGFLRRKFDVASIEYKWSAQQYRSSDGLPHIGISTGNKKTYIATGFAADGLTYGTLAAMIISDQILERENKWSNTYKAGRLTPVASFTNFVKENVSVGFHLVKDHLTKKEAEQFDQVRSKEGKIMTVDGKKCAVHRDEEGNLHVVSAICTHLGCVVHWNWNEQSWDCPCHGSRFTVDGEVIEGPAIASLKKITITTESR